MARLAAQPHRGPGGVGPASAGTSAVRRDGETPLGTPDTNPSAAPYERLAELAEAELAACEAKHSDDLADLYAEADALRASLPDQAPAAAEPALRRAAAAQRQISELLDARLAARGEDLDKLHRAREAAHAYATAANARATA